jgi:hypothetical protein
MAIEDDGKMLDEYMQWRTLQQNKNKDLSGTAFLIDQAKEQALDRLNQIAEYVSKRIYAKAEPMKIKMDLEEILEGKRV